MEKKKRKKIMILTDSPFLSTGYGSVMYNLLKRLSHRYDFYFIGNSAEREHEHKLGKGTFKALPRFSEFGYDVLGPHLREYNPDILLTLYDVGFQSGYVKIINKEHQKGWRGNWISYIPIDSETPNIFTWKDIFDSMDVGVAMSKFGQKYLKDNYNFDTRYIPHGVDTKIFHPRDLHPSANEFVVGAVGRNQIRKMWPVLFKAYSVFQKDKNDVKLFLHTEADPKDSSSGWGLKYLANKYKFNISLTTTKLNYIEKQFIDNEDMMRIYNGMDLFAFPTGGEGFGIPILEAMSCGIPTTITNYTTGKELCKDAGFKTVPVLKDQYGRNVMWEGLNGVEFAIADDKVLLKNLEYYYKKWKNGDYGDERYKARQHALKYDYDKIAEMWAKLFDELE